MMEWFYSILIILGVLVVGLAVLIAISNKIDDIH